MRLIDILNNVDAVNGFGFATLGDGSMRIYTEMDGQTDFLCVVPAEVLADLDKQHERGSFEWSCALDLMDVYQDTNDIWYVMTKSDIKCPSSELDDWL